MGTVADKLNKAMSTKAAIKAALIAQGQEVADTDTFASYADKVLAIKSSPSPGIPPGGTTGQALLKASDADGDVVWGDVIGSQCITEIKVVTSAEYNALTTKNDTTLYVIKE